MSLLEENSNYVKGSSTLKYLTYTAVSILLIALITIYTFASDNQLKQGKLNLHGDNKRRPQIKQKETRVCTFEERNNYIKKQCELFGEANHTKRSWLVDREHKLIYCYTPKISSSTWKSFLMLSNAKGKAHNEIEDIATVRVHQTKVQSRYGLSSVGLTELKVLQGQGYKTFMIIRNPFDRLVSAYRDKMLGSGYFGYYQNTVKKLATSAGLRNSSSKEQVKFQEFAYYLATKTAGNPHWRPYLKSCNPCIVDYDYILRTETMKHDALTILKILNQSFDYFDSLKRNVKQNETVNISHDSNVDLVVKPKYLIDFENVTKKVVKELEEKYKNEFQYFGYDFDSVKNESICGIKLPSGAVCC